MTSVDGLMRHILMPVRLSIPLPFSLPIMVVQQQLEHCLPLTRPVNATSSELLKDQMISH
jgi:hypothetical protein